MKSKTVAATYARIHFGEIMRDVADQGQHVLVERSGKPVVVVLSVADYQKLVGKHRMETADNALAGILRARNRRAVSTPPDKIASTIRELREERYECINRLP
jgi:prevent-host-death family protein